MRRELAKPIHAPGAVLAVLKAVKLPPRFRLKLVKVPVRLELTLTPAYGLDPILVGSWNPKIWWLAATARADPRGFARHLSWTVRHGKVSTGGWNPYLKEALQTMFETGLPALFTKKPPARLTTQWTARGTCADEEMLRIPTI